MDFFIDTCREKGYSDSAIEAIGIICCSAEMEEAVGSTEEGLSRVTEYMMNAKRPEEVMSFAHELASGEIK